ncbi:fibrous sheath-interacting protein 1 [Rhinophrynus dorsalis]
MDIMKGNLDDISRPAVISRSRPGSRVSSGTARSLEVLTPEVPSEQWRREKTDGTASDDRNLLSTNTNSENNNGEVESQKRHSAKKCAEGNGESNIDINGVMENLPPPPNSQVEVAVSFFKSQSGFPQRNYVFGPYTPMLVPLLPLIPSEVSALLSSHLLQPEDCLNKAGLGLDGGHDLSDDSDPEFSDSPPTECDGPGQENGKDYAEQHKCKAEKVDPKLEKAIKRMQALDEILLKMLAKEKVVKAQSLEIRKQLWEEFQHATMQTSARSHEENVNTDKFLALTPQLDETEDAVSTDNTFVPVFSTQLPTVDPENDGQEAIQGNISGGETSTLTSHKENYMKSQRKGVDFIQRNIELAKDAGSHVLLMDDEKLRLEQLLGDIQDGCSDEDITVGMSGWLVPGEGYTPEPGEYDQLKKIEAKLQLVQCTEDSFEISNSDISLPKNDFQQSSNSLLEDRRRQRRPCPAAPDSPPLQLALPVELERFSTFEVSVGKNGNSDSAPGEKVLRCMKELRDQKMRLKEIDQQLEDIERSISTSSLRSSSFSTDSSVYVS